MKYRPYLDNSQIRNVSGRKTSGVFLCLLNKLWLFLLLTFSSLIASASETNDFQPFETRDQNVFNLIHGQALPTNANLLESSQSLWSSSLAITNTLHLQNNSIEDIIIDVESYRFNFSYQYGLNSDWNLKLDIPVIHQGGGSFDSAIDNWHDFFGLPRGERPSVDHNQYNIQYSAGSNLLLDLNESTTTLGDIQLAVARTILNNNDTNMSFWAGLKLPTGNAGKLSGNDATDFSAWLAVNQKLSNQWLLNMNVGAVVLGDNDYQGIALANQVWYGHAMVNWIATENINLKAQLQGHSSYYKNSQLDILASTYLLTVGSTIKINRCQQFDIAISEDIKVDSSPDITLLISWRNYTSRC